MTVELRVVAISIGEYSKFGCIDPECHGCKEGLKRISAFVNRGGQRLKVLTWACPKCYREYVLLPEGVSKSPISFNGARGEYFPRLRRHPATRYLN